MLRARRGAAAIVLAAVAAACELAAVVVSLLLRSRNETPRTAALRDLSATDVITSPARRQHGRSRQAVRIE